MDRIIRGAVRHNGYNGTVLPVTTMSLWRRLWALECLEHRFSESPKVFFPLNLRPVCTKEDVSPDHGYYIRPDPVPFNLLAPHGDVSRIVDWKFVSQQLFLHPMKRLDPVGLLDKEEPERACPMCRCKWIRSEYVRSKPY